ncbi:DUF6318 family protein [Knoellia sp. CPCC 206453]|uniref:DUF6318 family protein n=1 Tax=Knoellia pratensis TaxID=3404796 RepID=UPI003610951A
MNKTWGRTAAMLSITALALAGCSDKDEPSTTPTPTASSPSASPSGSGSPSSSPTTSPSPSTNASVPTAARARTEAGAVAFLNFFVAEVNRGQTAPGTVDLFSISDKACIACKKLQTSLQDYVDNGWLVKQAPVQIHEPALANAATSERVIINFTYEQLPVDYYKDGSSQGKLDAAKTKNAAAIRWISGAWQMYGMEEL